MNFNFLTGKKNPYPGMDQYPGMDPFGTAPYFDMNTGQPQNVAIATPSVTPAAPSNMSMDKLGAGLSALGGALGGGQEQQIQPAEFAPVPMPQKVAMPNLTPQLPSFDFADYLRKRQAGLL